MIYVCLALEFFKTGLFSFGGGYATIPFLYHIAINYGWYSIEELKQMVAIAAITPGPVGLNVATFAGLKTVGIVGSMIATVSETLPSLILVIIISKILKKYRENFYIKSILESLKPISCALLLSTAAGLLRPSITDIKSLLLLIVLSLIAFKTKKNVLLCLGIAAIVGFVNVLL